MQTEIENTASFWLKYIPDASVTAEKKESFRQALVDILTDRYTGHWHVDKTTAGSGYRSMSNWKSLDSTLVGAAMQAGVPIEVLERHLPRDIVLWCDPYNVTYRVGDHGTVYTVYEDK
ncbi:anti-proliferative protein, partial [Martensiomyces pterosporus]